jgi:hypothetical protein
MHSLIISGHQQGKSPSGGGGQGTCSCRGTGSGAQGPGRGSCSSSAEISRERQKVVGDFARPCICMSWGEGGAQHNGGTAGHLATHRCPALGPMRLPGKDHWLVPPACIAHTICNASTLSRPGQCCTTLCPAAVLQGAHKSVSQASVSQASASSAQAVSIARVSLALCHLEVTCFPPASEVKPWFASQCDPSRL